MKEKIEKAFMILCGFILIYNSTFLVYNTCNITYFIISLIATLFFVSDIIYKFKK